MTFDTTSIEGWGVIGGEVNMESKNNKVITLTKREFKDKIFDYAFSKEWKYKRDEKIGFAGL